MQIFTQSTGVKFCKIINNKPICEFKSRGYISNGILINNTNLFVGDSVLNTVDIFEIQENFDLVHKFTVKITHGVDNLFVINSTVYITGVNSRWNALQGFESAKDEGPLKFMPGGISKVVKQGEKWISEEILMQDKVNLPTSAAIVNNQIIVNSLFDPALLFCPLD